MVTGPTDREPAREVAPKESQIVIDRMAENWGDDGSEANIPRLVSDIAKLDKHFDEIEVSKRLLVSDMLLDLGEDKRIQDEVVKRISQDSKLDPNLPQDRESITSSIRVFQRIGGHRDPNFPNLWESLKSKFSLGSEVLIPEAANALGNNAEFEDPSEPSSAETPIGSVLDPNAVIQEPGEPRVITDSQVEALTGVTSQEAETSGVETATPQAGRRTTLDTAPAGSLLGFARSQVQRPNPPAVARPTDSAQSPSSTESQARIEPTQDDTTAGAEEVTPPPTPEAVQPVRNMHDEIAKVRDAISAAEPRIIGVADKKAGELWQSFVIGEGDHRTKTRNLCLMIEPGDIPQAMEILLSIAKERLKNGETTVARTLLTSLADKGSRIDVFTDNKPDESKVDKYLGDFAGLAADDPKIEIRFGEGAELVEFIKKITSDPRWADIEKRRQAKFGGNPPILEKTQPANIGGTEYSTLVYSSEIAVDLQSQAGNTTEPPPNSPAKARSFLSRLGRSVERTLGFDPPAPTPPPDPRAEADARHAAIPAISAEEAARAQASSGSAAPTPEETAQVENPAERALSTIERLLTEAAKPNLSQEEMQKRFRYLADYEALISQGKSEDEALAELGSIETYSPKE